MVAIGGRFAGGHQGDVYWKLTTVESTWQKKGKNFTVAGQLPVEDEGIGWTDDNVLANSGGFGLPAPFVQWIRGELQVITIPVILYSRHKDENIKLMYDRVKRTKNFDVSLRRPPVCRFTFGSFMSMLVIVKGVGEARIARLKRDGKARRITFTLTLHKYEPFKREQIVTGKPPRESRHQLVTSERRMYEFIAAAEWGTENAIFGDRLRKRNRRYPFAAKDEGTVKIPNGDIILNERVEPEFHAFAVGNTEANEIVLEKFNARQSRVLVVSRK